MNGEGMTDYELALSSLRVWRNSKLQSTDWTQLPDSPVDKVEWSNYRQTLRDLPLYFTEEAFLNGTFIQPLDPNGSAD